MRIVKADLEAVAVKKEQYPAPGIPEIAFAGRSNVGKSSLLNLLCNRKKLARVSGSPGKTQTINFYMINDGEFRIVDLPGYGYAKVSKSQSNSWGPMMETYLKDREHLIRVVQLVDIRHDPSKQDVQMYEFLKYYGLSGTVVATKSDKISRNEVQKSLKNIRAKLGMDKADVIIPVTALKKSGHEKLLEHIEELLRGNNEESSSFSEDPVSSEREN
ncbi:MAG: ribosome biogenesis GTP-binding protein YihA/YsxC [Clostridia bacterium]|nr:ribosome biogenesis GTP-binding protein YihA/YsxC [Clostridia bacterium]